MCIAHTAAWILLTAVLICKQDGSREEAQARAKGTSSVWSGGIYEQGLFQILRKLSSLGRSWMVWYTYLCSYGPIKNMSTCMHIHRYIHIHLLLWEEKKKAIHADKCTCVCISLCAFNCLCYEFRVKMRLFIYFYKQKCLHICHW